MFVTTIACRLADSKAPGIQQCMHDSVGEHNQIANETLQDQGKQLVLQPLSRHQKKDIRSMFVIVVDRLCKQGFAASCALTLTRGMSFHPGLRYGFPP